MENSEIIIRLARCTDFEAMHDIYRHYIFNTAVTFEIGDPGSAEFADRIRREENDPRFTRDSVNFHTRMGYRAVGEFQCCGSKFGRWYNMVWMEKTSAIIRRSPTR